MKNLVSRKSKLVVQVEVLQNGTSMTRTQWSLSRNGQIALTSKRSGQLAIPFYPLPEPRVEFVEVTRGKVWLTSDHRWEGFCTSRGNLLTLNRGDKYRHPVEMVKGDYASVACGDLRILIKIAPLTSRIRHISKTDKSYRAPFLKHFFALPHEQKAMVAGFIMTLIILGGFTTGLMLRPREKPQGLPDLTPEYILPFIDGDHLAHAPEALQFKLNRQKYLDSVIKHYKANTAMMLGSLRFDHSYVFPLTADLYKSLYFDVRDKMITMRDEQRETDEKLMGKQGRSVLAIPSVVGESMAGSMLRIIDKIDIMHDALTLNYEKKTEIRSAFPDDPEYDFENYNPRPGTNRSAVAEYGKKVDVFKDTNDEEMMYSEAQRLAQKARTRQKIFSSRGDHLSVHYQPVGLSSGVSYASFLDDIDFLLADAKFDDIQASEFGVKKAKRREPLVGEIDPSLIERFIRKKRFQLQLCYELALRRNNIATGTMEWRWRIDSRGLPSNLALVSSTIRDRSMTRCIREKISGWRFPRPRRGSVEISYPFEFAPSRRG